MLTTEELRAHGIERLEGESQRAFKAFRAYLSLGAGKRSLRRFCDKTEFALVSVQKWHAVNRWQERAIGFDEAAGKAGLQRLLDGRLSLVLKTLEQSLADRDKFRRAIMKSIKGDDVSVQDLSRAIGARIELDRWAGEIFQVINALQEQDVGVSGAQPG